MTRQLPPSTYIVQVNGFSDGDPNHIPTNPDYKPSDPDMYMRKLATMWMEVHGGGGVPGEWKQSFMFSFLQLYNEFNSSIFI